jgi:hypothetical protein
MVKQIELPLLEGENSGVHEAFAATINDKKSALLFRSKGELRLVPFGNLEKAAAAGTTLLRDVDFEPVPTIATPDDAEQALRKQGSDFVLLETKKENEGERGVLAYLSDQKGLSYASPSAGFHCNRPGQPAGTPDRQWFHYYPPNRRDPKYPNRCRVCGSPLP